MPTHSDQQFLPYSPEQVFDLVADIARYPEFLPWCRAARILESGEGECLAELVISAGTFNERYTSRVRLDRPRLVEAVMEKGPFEHLINRWNFTPENGGTRVDFFLDFKFRSRILEKLVGGVFLKATARMTHAFRERADALYGPAKS